MKKYNYIQVETNQKGSCAKIIDTGDDENRIIAIKSRGDVFNISEQCDGYYNISMSKQEMIDTLKEFIDFIERS